MSDTNQAVQLNSLNKCLKFWNSKVVQLYYYEADYKDTDQPEHDVAVCDLSRPMGKPTICIGENKGADQLRGNREAEADQRLCFRYSDSTFPPLLNYKISGF